MNNIKALTESQRTLVENNLGLISYAMKKLPIYLFDSPEDAFQIGTIGLMKAARSFDPEKEDSVLHLCYAVHYKRTSHGSSAHQHLESAWTYFFLRCTVAQRRWQ